MRYVWKSLSLISAVLLVCLSIPTGIMMRLHMWLCKKANPDYDPFRAALDKLFAANPSPPKPGPKTAEEMGNAIAEMMKAMAPAVVEGAKSSVDKVMEKHRPFAWAEPPAAPTVNPVLPRVPGLPTIPTPPSHQTSGPCCCK